ncbi:hypothetical protein E6W39_15430 [Kitasatospora acidiphila]|uniref:Lipoprotein n=1 Tax=Kitasatospora acidiphila TaxID=2567942 RepID=A0A540W2W6_9ACTN|nr:hypothetical protein [Kitasatospora acidiphila]TQF03366.1 hypothetical protein E6W39_15430 [Kitasatospora acidiphila]
MYSSRLARSSAVLCAVLAAGATACGGSQGSSGKAAAPASAAFPASASASAAASPSVPDMSSMSADRVIDRIRATMGTVSSVHVAGYAMSDGQKMTLDVSAGKNKNCTGTVTAGDTGSIELIHNSTGTWIKPDATYWKSMATQKGNPQAGDAVAELFKGRWLTGAQDDPDLKGMAEMCGVLAGIDDALGEDSTKTSATKGDYAFVDGARALVVNVTDDSGPTVLYPAADAQPYLLRVVNNGSDGGIVDLSDYDKPLDIQARPADQVIDSGTFQQKVNSV